MVEKEKTIYDHPLSLVVTYIDPMYDPNVTLQSYDRSRRRVDGATQRFLGPFGLEEDEEVC